MSASPAPSAFVRPSLGRRIARVSIAATPEYVPAVLGFVRDVSATLGLPAEALDCLVAAAEEVVTNVVTHGFDPGEEGSVDVTVLRRPGALVVTVEDRGLPFDFRALTDRSGALLGPLAEPGLVDSLRFMNLGVDGNRVEIVKRLPSTAAGQADRAPAPSQPAPPSGGDVPLTLRLMGPDDTEAVTRCTYRTYGYSAPTARLYDADHLRELLASGLYAACIGVAPDGEVVSYLDLEMDRPDARVAITGDAMVDPRFRGHALFERMKRFVREHAVTLNLFGVYAEAVTVHPYSQKGELAVGGRETGVQLADERGSVLFKDLAASAEPKRTATILYYDKVADGAPRVVYAPDRHRAMIQRIYEHNALPRDVASERDEPAPSTARSRVAVEVFPDWGEASITVLEYGPDLPELIRSRLRELCVRRIDWINVDLPLGIPGAARHCPALEALGLFFAGIVPELADGDVLRLQYLNELDPDLEPHIASDFGRELFDYVLAARPAG